MGGLIGIQELSLIVGTVFYMILGVILLARGIYHFLSKEDQVGYR